MATARPDFIRLSVSMRLRGSKETRIKLSGGHPLGFLGVCGEDENDMVSMVGSVAKVQEVEGEVGGIVERRTRYLWREEQRFGPGLKSQQYSGCSGP